MEKRRWCPRLLVLAAHRCRFTGSAPETVRLPAGWRSGRPHHGAARMRRCGERGSGERGRGYFSTCRLADSRQVPIGRWVADKSPPGRSAAAPLLLRLAAVAAALLAAAAASPARSDFVRKSCRATQYPSVCEQSLASYGGSPPPRSPRELARAASAYVGRLCGSGHKKGAARKDGAPSSSAAGPVRDCLENLADSVGHLRDAAQEMGGAGMSRAGTPAFKWHLSNVQTWCSAALTDENTCLDGLSSRGVDAATRAAIRGKVVEVAQVTSNALALVNKVGPAGY